MVARPSAPPLPPWQKELGRMPRADGARKSQRLSLGVEPNLICRTVPRQWRSRGSRTPQPEKPVVKEGRSLLRPM